MNKQDEHSRELWNRFLAGDGEAFGLLYTAHVNRLYGYGLHFTSGSELVKDCVQDLFVKLYANRKRLQAVGNVRVYLCHALKNMLFNALKKEPGYCPIDAVEPVFHIDLSAETLMIESEQRREQKQRIARMMENLTPRQQEILYYRFVEELSHEEIGRLMQMNDQSVRNLLHRTILKIRSTATGKS
ncbi:MAG: sigma-70 family RNA polymerase sigma factor [Tannerella sp.]|jgi:RNA polymerase sigma factor (sigma-70 family)|nr:sigma-70 family RNA polymerase sigma factor [Tannerella sp.]